MLLLCCLCCHNSPQPLNQIRAPVVLGAVQPVILVALGLQASLVCFLSGEEPPGLMHSEAPAVLRQSLEPQGSDSLLKPAQHRSHVTVTPTALLPLCLLPASSDGIPSTSWWLCQPSWHLETALEYTAKDPAPDLSFTSATAAGRETALAWCFPQGTGWESALQHLQCFYYPH